MKSFSFTIMGAKWSATIMSRSQFDKLNPDCIDTEAVCICKKRQIHFVDNELTKGIIRHEIRHAFTHELCIYSAELTAHQMEEVQCELDELRWDEMNHVSTELFKNLIES